MRHLVISGTGSIGAHLIDGLMEDPSNQVVGVKGFHHADVLLAWLALTSRLGQSVPQLA